MFKSVKLFEINSKFSSPYKSVMKIWIISSIGNNWTSLSTYKPVVKGILFLEIGTKKLIESVLLNSWVSLKNWLFSLYSIVRPG